MLGMFNRKMSLMTVSARATGGGANTSQTCLCLKAGSGQDLYLYGGASISVPTCGVVVNSNSSNAIAITDGATLDASTLGTVSTTWNTPSNLSQGGSVTSTTKIVTGITSTCSPAMPAAPTYTAAACLADPGGSSVSFIAGPATSSGTVCYKSLTVGANGTLDTLNPGIYVITSGALHFESGYNGKANLGGNGVFFYLTGTSSLVIDNGANVNLVAGGSAQSGGGKSPSLGAYDGILVYQASGDTTALTTQGGSTAYMDGALYAPSASIQMGNGSGSTTIGGIVAQTLTMYGGASLTATAATNEGSLVISNPKLAQ
jgi:hypothetical protein